MDVCVRAQGYECERDCLCTGVCYTIVCICAEVCIYVLECVRTVRVCAILYVCTRTFVGVCMCGCAQ